MKRTIVAMIAALVAILGLAPSASAATAYVTYPFFKDYIGVYNKLNVTGTTTAAHWWENNTGIDLVPMYTEPRRGITIQWNSSKAGSNVAGWAVANLMLWDGSNWEAGDCTVNISTNVNGNGPPTGSHLQAIVAHEVGHCLGHWPHSEYPSIMRSSLNRYDTVTLGYKRPTSIDLARMREAYYKND